MLLRRCAELLLGYLHCTLHLLGGTLLVANFVLLFDGVILPGHHGHVVRELHVHGVHGQGCGLSVQFPDKEVELGLHGGVQL